MQDYWMAYAMRIMVLLASYNVNAEVVAGNGGGGGGGDDDDDDGSATNHVWVLSALQDQLRQIADVWASRVVVTIAIIVLWEVFSPERQRRRHYRRQRNDQSKQSERQQEPRRRGEDNSTKSPSSEAADESSDRCKNPKKETEAATNGVVGGECPGPTRLLDRLEEEQQADKNVKLKEEPDTETIEKAESTIEEKQENETESTDQSNSEPPRQPTGQRHRQLVGRSTPPRIKASTNTHPGMAEFTYWYDVETSLYRVYTLTRKDGEPVVPPYVPQSHRGNIPIFLHVTNSTNHTINVYWVDYKGKHIPKGKIKPNHQWTQTSWIDHPWVFEDAFDQQPYLYYVPYRTIPTLPSAPTLCPDDETGQHKFSLVPSKLNDEFLIGIQDDVMPHPGITRFHQPLEGITWTLTHMSRLMIPEDPAVDTLQKYLKNIMEHPETVKYRQLRVASKAFAPIWQSPMRGLLHAVGFVEVGAYAELGCHDFPLSRERVQEVALLSYLLTQWRFKPTAGSLSQPEGAVDGFGRAGYGRAGTINGHMT